MPPPPEPIDLLILGAGWTASHFLIPFLASPPPSTPHYTYAYTTRDGRGGSIPFTFDPDPDAEGDDDDDEDERKKKQRAEFEKLPDAKTVLVCFPLKGPGQSKMLVGGYETTHGTGEKGEGEGEGDGRARWIQLGSTGIFKADGWNDESSPHDGDDPFTPGKGNQRAVAEDELLALCGERAVVLNLAGLYDGETRRPRDWVSRVVKGKEGLKGKGVLHLVHGRDVSRGVVGCLKKWEGVGGGRWIVTDLRVYDWWDLVMGWGGGEEGEYRRWVVELMREEGVRALPRETGELGRVLDGRAFWEAIGWWPEEGRVT